MIHHFFIIAFFLLIMSLHSHAQIKTLRDSLLEYYTMDELKKMSPIEFGNALRVIRGQEPHSLNQPEYDFYGIKIVENIPQDSLKPLINERILLINNEKEYYRQEVFPNALIDVQDGYGFAFYESFTKRIVSEINKQSFFDLVTEFQGGKSPFSNFSRRVYFFNEKNELRLITREMGYNVNPGEKYNSNIPLPLKYSYEEFYIWEDILQSRYKITGEQFLSSEYPDYWTKNDVDSTLVAAQAWRTLHYKNNCFNYQHKSARVPLQEWKLTIDSIPFNMQPDCANGTAITLKNLIEEREEYYKNKNKYLHPVITSFLKPYVVEAKE